MPKSFLLLFLLFLGENLFAQNPQKLLRTIKIAGEYEYGTSAEKERVGLAYIYAESDSTIIFYLDLNAGPPSMSMGAIYGRVRIKNDAGLFVASFEGAEDPCKFLLKFNNDQLVIETKDGQYSCGFGQGVYVDGTFKRKSKKNPEYFLNPEGNKVYFKTLRL